MRARALQLSSLPDPIRSRALELGSSPAFPASPSTPSARRSLELAIAAGIFASAGPAVGHVAVSRSHSLER